MMTGEELRPWQRPLSDNQLADLAEQFAAAKDKIERMWGPGGRPWHPRRDDA